MSSDALAQLDREALEALCAGPAATPIARPPVGRDSLGASAFGRALLEARSALRTSPSPAAALHLAALAAQTRALAPYASAATTLRVIERPREPVEAPLAPDELLEVLTALRGDYDDGEHALLRALALRRLPDLRVLPAAIDALRKTRVAPFVAREVLPAYGPVAARARAAGFDPQGRASHAWRVTAAARVESPESERMVLAGLAEGSAEVQHAALAGASRVPWQRVESAALAVSRRATGDAGVPWFLSDAGADAEQAELLFDALALCPTDAALDALLAGLSRVRANYGWSAAASLRAAAHPRATERLVLALDRSLRAVRSGPDEVLPAAVLYALADPRHASALDALRALPLDPKDPLLWFAHRYALAALGHEPARDELARFSAAPARPATLLALRRFSGRPLLDYARYALAPERLATPQGLSCADALLDAYVPPKEEHAAPWAAVYAPALAHPVLFKKLRRALDAHHARILRAADPGALYAHLAPQVLGPAATERACASVLAWVAQWPAAAVDPRWTDVAAGHLAGRTPSSRTAAIELLAQREDPRCVEPMRATLEADLRKRSRAAVLYDALAIYRPPALVAELSARLGSAKPKSWTALYLERLIDRAKQPRFALAPAGSWSTE